MPFPTESLAVRASRGFADLRPKLPQHPPEARQDAGPSGSSRGGQRRLQTVGGPPPRSRSCSTGPPRDLRPLQGAIGTRWPACRRFGSLGNAFPGAPQLQLRPARSPDREHRGRDRPYLHVQRRRRAAEHPGSHDLLPLRSRHRSEPPAQAGLGPAGLLPWPALRRALRRHDPQLPRDGMKSLRAEVDGTGAVAILPLRRLRRARGREPGRCRAHLPRLQRPAPDPSGFVYLRAAGTTLRPAGSSLATRCAVISAHR